MPDAGMTAASDAYDLYFTGHRDGRVRVWELSTNVPALLATVPHDSGGPGGRLRGVTALQASSMLSLYAWTCNLSCHTRCLCAPCVFESRSQCSGVHAAVAASLADTAACKSSAYRVTPHV